MVSFATSVLRMVVAVILFAACSKSNHVVPTQGLDTINVSFSNRVQPIFTTNCALAAVPKVLFRHPEPWTDTLQVRLVSGSQNKWN